MRFLPVGLDLRERPCTVVGGGAVGARKALRLADAGARVTVIAPAVTDAIAAELGHRGVQWRKARFEPAHLEGVQLVVVATDDPETNAVVAGLARERGILLCDATCGERSEVIFGAVFEDDGLTVATFTDGQEPGRARRVRDEIAEWLSADARTTGTGTADDSLLILVAHGSRDPAWGAPLEALARSLSVRTGPDSVQLAYSQFASPSLEEAVKDAAANGHRRIRVLPLFMTAGGHVERDIRPVIEALGRAHEDTDIELLPPVGELPAFRILLLELAREVSR